MTPNREKLIFIPFHSFGPFVFGHPKPEVSIKSPPKIRPAYREEQLLMLFLDQPKKFDFQMTLESEPVHLDAQELLGWVIQQKIPFEEAMSGFFVVPRLGLTVTLGASGAEVERICLISKSEFISTYGSDGIAQVEPVTPPEPKAKDNEFVPGQWEKELKEARKKFEARADFKPWRRPAHIPVCKKGAPKATESGVGGKGWLMKGEARPKCGVCKRQLSFVFQWRASDLPEKFHIEFEGMLQFFVCSDVDCLNESSPESSDDVRILLRVIPPAKMKTMVPAMGEDEEIPTDDYLDDDDVLHSPSAPIEPARFENWKKRWDYPEELRNQLKDGSKEDSAFFSLYPERGDKFGEWPAWSQQPDIPECKECNGNGKQVFFMQLASQELTPIWWGDAGRASFFQCSRHPDVYSVVWAGT